MKKFSELPFLVRLGITVALGAAIVGAGEYLWLGDKITANQTMKDEVKKLHDENEKVKPIESQFRQLKIKNEQLEQQLANLRNIVPEEKNADDYIRMLQDAAVQSGISIRNFTAKAVSNKEFYAEMPFDISIDGNYYSVLGFFDRLGKLSRISNITNLAMGPVGGAVRGVSRRYTYTPNETVLAGCTVTTFFSREAPATTAPAKK